MRMLSPASSEYQVVRTYLDWILSLPWNKRSGSEEIDLKKVQEALDSRHYGLDEAKERIIEFLAVRKLRGGDPHGPILCFVGPPGTGKTSLGEAIGLAIGREFYRISVGGVRDEAEVRGHRRTYVGAMPGLLIQALRRVQVKDPVLMIDEIDKMSGGGPSGDPTAAMLEVLDPSQNDEFVDHYLNLPFDLSACLFICTANNLFDIPAPLRDRMEIIKIAGYTVEEKVEIAWRYLLPRLLEDHGITDRTSSSRTSPCRSSPAATRARRDCATSSATSPRSCASARARRRRARKGPGSSTSRRWRRSSAFRATPWRRRRSSRKSAWSPASRGPSTGGDLMVIEALRMPGSGRMTVTGQLGDVMRESVDAAYSYVRSRASQLGIEDSEFKEIDLHIHLPAGAIPKDGPSAGITLTLAIASVLSGRPVRRDVAMTGEVTLRGKVLEIGGVKEKVLAGVSRGHSPDHHAEVEREGPARGAAGSARSHGVHIRRTHGRGAASRVAPAGVARDRGRDVRLATRARARDPSGDRLRELNDRTVWRS